MWGCVIRSLHALALVALTTGMAAAQVRVTASWDANGDPVTAGYRVFVGGAPGQYTGAIDTGRATSTTLSLPPGGVYYLTVRAYTAAGVLGPSAADVQIDLSSPPGPPQSVRASVSGSLANIEWAPPVVGGAPLQYLLSVGTAAGASNLLHAFPVAALSASGALPPGVYFARLQAQNLVGAGPASPDIAFQVLPGMRPLGPYGLTVTWSGTTARFTWTPPQTTDPGQLPTSYVLEAGSSTGLANLATMHVGVATSVTTEVPPGVYFVRVRGVNAYGTSDPSNEVVVQGAAIVPQAPQGLSSSGGGNVVNLWWGAPGNGVAPSGYVIEAGSAPGLSNIGSFNVGNTTSISTTVPPGTYYVRVRGIGPHGLGAPSNEIVIQR